MQRNDVINLLESYNHTEEEATCKKRMLSFIQNHENCFDRSLSSGHVTASSWLLNSDGTKALLMHHTKLNRWLQLGGHCDGNPNILEVAIKEAQEESGIDSIVPVTPHIFDIGVHLIPANKKEAEHYHYDIRFLLQTRGSDEVVQNRESKELRWISKNQDELPTQSRSVVRMFEKWLLTI